MKWTIGKSFGKKICKLILRRNGQQVNELGLDLLPYEVAINLYVFGFFVKYRIMSNMESRLIVTKSGCWVRVLYLKISQYIE